MTEHSPTPEHTIDRTLEHGLGAGDELRARLDTVLTVVDLNDVLARIEAKVLEARAALEDEAEGRLTRAIDTIVVEAFLAHRVVSTW